MDGIWVSALAVAGEEVAKLLQRLEHAGLEPLQRCDQPRGGVGLLIAERAESAALEEGLLACRRHGARALLLLTRDEDPSRERLSELHRYGVEDARCWRPEGTCPGTVASRLVRWLAIEHALEAERGSQRLCFTSAALRSLLRQVLEVAMYTSDPILLLGESGTGKEEVARLIHRVDRRAEKGAFVLLDASTIPPELAASEFFGHERGAFTGALADREGAFALADGGTLFLDEVGELPLPLQAQLLRVIQERSYKPLGSSTWKHSDFRLISATHRELDGSSCCRRDFFHRISRWVFRLPSLRERPEDILPLAAHFAEQRLGIHPGFEERLQRNLLLREYTGNARELRNLVLRLCGLHVGAGPLALQDLPTQDLASSLASTNEQLERAASLSALGGDGLKSIERRAREAAIDAALGSCDGHVPRAAKLLGISDRALQMERAKRLASSASADEPASAADFLPARAPQRAPAGREL
ncbi:MAG: sigma-54-dependent Fis family transcriptional regulator [Planctomycetes bacterium]|nr:sigma-54-dependent Fis family transcriptional regulator [Planctomycetota bacterium]